MGAERAAATAGHRVAGPTGIDITTGAATKNFRMFFDAAKGGWHLFPVL